MWRLPRKLGQGRQGVEHHLDDQGPGDADQGDLRNHQVVGQGEIQKDVFRGYLILGDHEGGGEEHRDR